MIIMKLKSFFKLPFNEKKICVRRKILPYFRKSYKSFGKNSDIYKPIMVYNKQCISIGDNVLIRNGARIEAVVSWGEKEFVPCIRIGNNVSIEERFHLICANSVVIEDDVLIAGNVMVTDCEHEYRGQGNVCKQGLIVKTCFVGRNTFIGKNVCILAGVTIGKNCVIGANSVVTHDLPDGVVAVGAPARIIKQRKN